MSWLRYVTVLLIVILTVVFVNPVSGQVYSDVQHAVQTGHYAKAVEIGKTLDTVDSLSLASEALAKEIMLGEADNPLGTAKTARDLAEKALEKDANHQNARLQFVVTDGFVARYTGEVSAWFRKLPQKSLTHIQDYRTDFPNDPRGDALMGAWHLEIIRKAGEENALKWFGARADYGQAFFEKALNQDPNDPIIYMNYAFALIALAVDEKTDESVSNVKNMERAKALLERAQSISASDDLMQKMKAKANKALSLFEAPQDLKAYVDDFF